MTYCVTVFGSGSGIGPSVVSRLSYFVSTARTRGNVSSFLFFILKCLGITVLTRYLVFCVTMVIVICMHVCYASISENVHMSS